MAQPEPVAKQRDPPPIRNVPSPGRRAYNTRLLSTKSHITATNPHMSMAEASRLALKSVGPYVPSSQTAPSQQGAAAGTPKTAEEKAAPQASVRKGLMAPMTGVTSAQDKASRIAVREAVAARMAQAGSSSAMSAYRHYASRTKDQLESASTQPQQSPNATLLQPHLQASIPQLQQHAMHPEQENAEQTAGSSAAKVDADKDNWSAQLRAACHTLGQEQVNNLAAAKDELARALLYVKSTENTLRGLKRQIEVVTGSNGLEWYLLREQRYVQSDIESECARIATLVYLVKNLEHGTQSH